MYNIHCSWTECLQLLNLKKGNARPRSTREMSWFSLNPKECRDAISATKPQPDSLLTGKSKRQWIIKAFVGNGCI